MLQLCKINERMPLANELTFHSSVWLRLQAHRSISSPEYRLSDSIYQSPLSDIAKVDFSPSDGTIK